MNTIKTFAILLLLYFTLFSLELSSKETKLNLYGDFAPKHLQNAIAFECPKEIIDLLSSYGVINIFLVDDKNKCNRSIRFYDNIFINVRGTCWLTMILPPWSCNTFSEAIALRLLHEVGHVTLKHKGGIPVNATPQEIANINKNINIWNSLDGLEGDCWEFAFQYRKEKQEDFNKLLDYIYKWLTSHSFFEKDWDDTADLQWKRINNSPLPVSLWDLVPRSINDRYHHY